MGMFGKQAPFSPYSSTEPEPSMGAKLLNLVGESLLGVNYLGMKRKEDLANQQKAWIADTLAKLAPQFQPGSPGSPGVPGMQGPGEDGDPIGRSIPSTPATPTTMLPPRLTANSPDLASQMFRGAILGAPTAPVLDALKAQQPDVNYVNGFRYDKKVPGSGPAFAPTLDKGQEPLFDANGRVAGIRNIDGSVQSAAEMAGATAGATAKAQAHYQLPALNLPGGDTQQVPGDVAPEALLRSIMGGPGAMSGLGRSQTPAAAEIAKGRAATQGKNEADIAGARSAMQQVDDQTNMIAQNLHDMLGETQDPNTGKWVKTKPSMITGLSTGSQTDLIEHVPFLNQQAKDLAAKIETVRNGTSFNSLQAIKNAMAAAGDGGTGSIRMTDQTARMLGEINGSLQQNQSGPQFEATLRRHVAQLDQLARDRHNLFESQYRGVQQPMPGQTGPTANYNHQAPAAPPQPGQVVKGYKYLGGNPADPKSWARP